MPSLAEGLLVFAAACASPPATHTIAPARASGEPTQTHWPEADTVRSLKTLHTAIVAWRANHTEECPTAQRLKDELAASWSTSDVWGSPYKVLCDEDESHVVSYGPDRREGTPDDITYP